MAGKESQQDPNDIGEVFEGIISEHVQVGDEPNSCSGPLAAGSSEIAKNWPANSIWSKFLFLFPGI